MVVIGDLLLLELCKKLGPEVEHHPLTDIIEQDLLHVRKDEAEQKHPEKREGKQPDAIHSLGRDKVVHSHFGKIRLCADEHVGKKR